MRNDIELSLNICYNLLKTKESGEVRAWCGRRIRGTEMEDSIYAGTKGDSSGGNGKTDRGK